MADIHDLMQGTILELDEPVSSEAIASWRHDGGFGGSYTTGAQFEVVETRSAAAPGCALVFFTASNPRLHFAVPASDLSKFRVVG